MIKKEDRELGARAYEKQHIDRVVKQIENEFPSLFNSFIKHYSESNPFAGNPNFKVVTKFKEADILKKVELVFNDAIEAHKKDLPSYKKLFDLESLDEDQDDPNAFKKTLSTRIPIINRCLQSKAQEMQRYQVEFYKKSGREILNVTSSIISFGNKYTATFDDNNHEQIVSVDALDLSELLEERYVAYNVIGGGIKSNFLHTLFPHAFAYRSQNALWSLWYLTSKKDFGFPDGSEFLMLDTLKGTTQQNYHYPYDLFCYYALKIYLLLKESCKQKGISFQNKYRYIYLDAFLNHIAEIEKEEISFLKKSGNYAG